MASSGVLDIAALIDARRIGPAQWMIIALCACVALLDGLDLQSIGLAAPAIGAELHISPPAFGPVFSIALVGLALGAFVLGPLADRIGRKGVLIAATLCFGLFTLATGAVTSFNELLAARFFTGLGLGGAMPSFIALASDYVPRPKRAAIVALVWAGFPLGGVIGGFLGSWIIPAYGWHAIFVFGGILPIGLALLLAVFLPESASFLVNTGKPAARIARTLRRVLPDIEVDTQTRFLVHAEASLKMPVTQLFVGGRSFGTLLLWISFFFTFMILVANSSWSPTLLRLEGMPIERSAIAMAIFNFGSLIGSAAAGWMVTRFGPSRVLPLSLVVGAASYGLIGWAAPDAVGVTAAQAVFGLTLGTASSGLIALAAVYYPSMIRSTGVGWATGLGRIGSATGPLVIGQLVGAHWRPDWIFATIGASIPIAALASALMGLLRADSGTQAADSVEA